MLERKRQVLDVAIPARGLIVDADPARLAQVLANLLTNAAKYSDPETPRSLFAAEHGRAACASRVERRGDRHRRREMLDRVFDLFVQQRQAIDRSQGGLGLGLAIVRSLVDAARRHASGRSARAKGTGSEFVVELPRASARPAERRDAARGARSRQGGRRGPSACSSSTTTRTRWRCWPRRSRRSGYVVRTAHDGPTALRVGRGVPAGRGGARHRPAGDGRLRARRAPARRRDGRRPCGWSRSPATGNAGPASGSRKRPGSMRTWSSPSRSMNSGPYSLSCRSSLSRRERRGLRGRRRTREPSPRLWASVCVR